MRPWTKLLPFCVVCWIAKKYGERFHMDGRVFVHPYRDTLIEVGMKPHVTCMHCSGAKP